MTPEALFDRAFDSARQDRKELVQFLAGVSAAQARWYPPNEEWSILQGLEHVMLTEAYFRQNILRTLEKASRSATWDNTPATTHAKMSAEALRRREQGFVAAPEQLEPRGEGDFHTMQAALIADRETSRDALLPYRTQDLSRLIFPHPRYGDRNLYDVIEYSGIHDYLHREQMERVTQHPDYPAT